MDEAGTPHHAHAAANRARDRIHILADTEAIEDALAGELCAELRGCDREMAKRLGVGVAGGRTARQPRRR